MAERSSLVRLLEEFELELDWHGFELHPETPPGGARLDEMFPPEKLSGMADYMTRFAAQFGIEGFQQRDRIPNTRRALALAEVARDEGKLEAYRQCAMDAHWRDGMDLENDADLASISRDAGLSDDAVEKSRAPAILERVDAAREEANAIGVQGIPTFVIGNLGLSGCQPYPMFEQFAKQAGASRRRTRADSPP